jgi:hypothetical protein
VQHESEETEISRLRKQQDQARHDEVFGGMSPEERAAYDIRRVRLQELERHLFPRDWHPGKSGFLA